jgi:2-dehydro-3-deoxyphosphogluconate aldolase/(4S)-4-hydroxy-2-oxoglutarate aldolase
MREIMGLAPVIPVLKFDDVETALAVSRALVAGGLPVIEITLRTKAALDCIAAVAKSVEGAIVGAGTVLNGDMATDCVDMGAQFLVSPGATASLLTSQRKSHIPLLPGIATPSEAMALVAEGYEAAKFFPAEQVGGPDYLKALGSILPSLTFCPTGGLDAERAKDYLALPNVACVGGSWVAPGGAIAEGRYQEIEALAAKATLLGD